MTRLEEEDVAEKDGAWLQTLLSLLLLLFVVC